MKCQRQILRIRWHDHVRNDEVAAHTGLRPVMESIKRRREAIFGHVARMSPNILAHQALRLQVETSLGRRPDRDWVAALVAPATTGSTNSARTISAHLLTYVEQPSSVVTLERRYGHRRLRDDDDDDDGAWAWSSCWHLANGNKTCRRLFTRVIFKEFCDAWISGLCRPKFTIRGITYRATICA